MRALVLTLAACGGGPTLELDGPLEVRVDRLGPVEGPVAVLSDGGSPEGVAWSAEPPAVARVQDGRIVAEGEGEAVVTGSWQGQQVSWRLAVVPSYELIFVDPPAAVAIGESVKLAVSARRGGESTVPTALAWSSSDPAVLTVSDDGTATGASAGLAFVTVQGHGSTAMAELLVR